MRVILDTNTYRAFMDANAEAVSIIRGCEAIYLPVPVLAELKYGFLNGSKGLQNDSYLTKFMDSPRVRILSCDEQTAYFYAQLKLQLKKQGTPIPINDVWIAALSIQHSIALYTLDTDFNHIPQLARV